MIDKPCFLPIINSVASLHLTPADWCGAKLTFGALDLPQFYHSYRHCEERFLRLRAKARQSNPESKSDLDCFVGLPPFSQRRERWPGAICLNGKNDELAQYKINSENFKIHSLKYSASEVLDLAQLFKVDICILPSYLGYAANRSKLFKFNQHHLNEALAKYVGDIPLIVEFDLLQQQALCSHVDHQAICGYLYDANSYAEASTFLTALTHQTQLLPDCLHYVIADYDWQQILQAIAAGATCVQSDKPANDGARGLLYNTSGDIDITSEKCAQQFTPIDVNCDGYCCKNFTIAYLHHLYKHNVLLGTRLQVLHNLQFVNSMIAAVAK